VPVESLDRLQNGRRFRLQKALHDYLAAAIHDGHRDRCLPGERPCCRYTSLGSYGAPFGKVVMRTITTYRKVGAFYIA
jgi:hypothetical protein